MALAQWSTLYPDILVEVPGCPYPVIDNAIRRAAIELCTFAQMFVVDLDTFQTVADQAAYPLTYDTDTDIIEVVELRSSAGPITERTLDSFRAAGILDTTRETVTSTYPSHYWKTNQNTVRMYGIPDTDDIDIDGKVALAPKDDATGLESWVMSQYRDELVAGALARLLNMGTQPWSSKEEAKNRKDEFEKAKGEARVDAMRNFTSSSIVAQPRRFGG